MTRSGIFCNDSNPVTAAFRQVGICLVMLLSIGLPTHLCAQTPAAPTDSKPAAAEALPLGEVALASETDLSRLANIENDLIPAADVTDFDRALGELKRNIDLRLRESRKIRASQSSAEALRTLERTWTRTRDTLSDWEHELGSRLAGLQRADDTVTQIQQRWMATQTEAQADSSTPQPTLDRIGDVVKAAAHADQALGRARARILTLQDKVAEQEARVTGEVDAIQKSRTAALTRLLDRDSPPIWTAQARNPAFTETSEDAQDSSSAQFTQLGDYLSERSDKLWLQLGAFLVLYALMAWVRRQVRNWIKEEPELQASTRVFDIPIATAALLTLIVSFSFYPDAPRLLLALLGIAALIPAVIILRHIITPALFAILYALVIFYMADEVRVVTASLAWQSRLLLLGEAVAGALLASWLLGSHRFPPANDTGRPKFWAVVKTACYVSLGIFVLSALANVLGFVSLADILAGTLLTSAYSGLCFYALLRIADGLIVSALRLYPLARLRAVRLHRALIRDRILKVLQWGVWILWATAFLERLSLRAPLVHFLSGLLGAQSSIGSLHIALGDIVAAALTVVAAFLISRLIRFALDEEVYPHVSLPRGMPYALSRLLHYTILVIGFTMAVAAAGVDLTRFTILASAFGVGIGFGLQNIINNFVSGIILLFERPVQVGDAVQIADVAGVVDRIGIRASLIRLANGAEVIVPNSNFITERVTNRALTNPETTIEIKIAVAYGTDAATVITVLKDVATKHPRVVKAPAPQALFLEFGDEAVYFKLQVATDNAGELAQIRSDLGVEIDKLFSAGTLKAPSLTQRPATAITPAT